MNGNGRESGQARLTVLNTVLFFPPVALAEKVMSKYAPFGEFLAKQKGDHIRLSFDQVEKVIGFKLPKSAYLERTWWSNNPDNNVMTKVWRRAKFRTTSVDMEKRVIVFVRQKKATPPSAEEKAGQAESLEKLRALIERDKRGRRPRHPLRGALKGHLRLVGGTDLTKPADPDWGDM